MAEKNEREQIMQRAKVLYFRNFDLTHGDMRTIVPEEWDNNSERYARYLRQGDDWRADWQGRCWGADWFVAFVAEAVRTHDGDPSTTVKYADMTPTAQTEFWRANDRWTKERATRILTPLKKAIDIAAILADGQWRRHVLIVWIVACKLTWKYRCLPQAQRLAGDGSAKVDLLQIYQGIRTAAATLNPNRPPATKVPLNLAGVLDEERRDREPRPVNHEDTVVADDDMGGF